MKAFLFAMVMLITSVASAGITTAVPDYQDYTRIKQQLEEWNREAPGFVELYSYGRTSRGQDIVCARITDESVSKKKYKVLLTACIHGNEPLATSVMMGTVGSILQQSETNKFASDLLDCRDIWIIPVISPDSYPHSRHVEGLDPNRNYDEGRSVAPIQALKEFSTWLKPHAMMSGHTFGRVFLYPHGNKTRLCPHDAQYRRILNEMGRLSQYRVQRGCKMYNKPIYGTEIDWFYENFKAFSVVIEFGEHQRIPSRQDIRYELNRTYKSILFFIAYAPGALDTANTSEVAAWKKLEPKRPNTIGGALGDIDSQLKSGHIYRDNDKVTWGHETTHGINSRARQLFGDNAFYVGNGDVFVIDNPPGVTLRDVANAVPQEWRGSIYNLYLVNAQRWWNDSPYYVVDELTGYTNGTIVGLQYDMEYRTKESFAFALEMLGYCRTAEKLAKDEEFSEFLRWYEQHRILSTAKRLDSQGWLTASHLEYLKRYGIIL
jgi:hypothetical protein